MGLLISNKKHGALITDPYQVINVVVSIAGNIQRQIAWEFIANGY
jgi:hypothetical protein